MKQKLLFFLSFIETNSTVSNNDSIITSLYNSKDDLKKHMDEKLKELQITLQGLSVGFVLNLLISCGLTFLVYNKINSSNDKLERKIKELEEKLDNIKK